MLTWFDMLVAEQRRYDRMRRSEHERLVRLVLLDQRACHPRVTHRFMVFLGDALVSWGKRLQRRYVAFADSSMVSSQAAAVEQRQSPATCGGR